MKDKKLKSVVALGLALLLQSGLFPLGLRAQDSSGSSTMVQNYYSTVLTGAPLLTIVPDARSAALGGIGTTSAPSAFSLYHNAAQLPMLEQKWGISLGYTPWMPEVAKDMSLSSLFGYYRWNDMRHDIRFAVAGAFRYFNIGGALAFPVGSFEPVPIHPYELAFNVGMGAGFGKHWSAGLTLGYFLSDYNYALDGVKGKAGSILVDLSGSYRSDGFSLGREKTGVVTATLAINNIGGKLTYDGGLTKLYMPAVLRLGQGLDIKLDDKQELGIYLEESKLLAPTLPTISPEMSSEEVKKVRTKYQEQNAIGVLFSSWGDAPGGFSEEMKEVNIGVGAEYRYFSSIDFALRLGYQHQHPQKGTGAGFTFGAGFGYQMVQLDLSYFVANKSQSPLNNTFRISLGIDLGK